MAESPGGFSIHPLTEADRIWVGEFLVQRWGDTRMITRGKSTELTQLPGYAARIEDTVVGLVTYQVEAGACEITSLDSLVENLGIGSALIQSVRQAAEMAGCERLWLITTNDNLHALGFYQKRGFRLVAVHTQAIDLVTRRMKPGIPLTGHDGIPLRDEIELEILLAQASADELPKKLPDFPLRLARRVIYACPWLTLYQDRVRLPDGRILPNYHVIEFLHAVGVLVENERGELLFERVYRNPTGRLEWEIPAGALDAEEDPLEAAQREVYEETGYETHDHRLVYAFYPNDGNTNQLFYLVHCRAGTQAGSVDAGEIQDFKWMGEGEIDALIRSGEMMDGLSLTAVLLARFQSGP